MKPPVAWRVKITAHEVDRWTIPARTVTVGATSIDHARELAIGEAQRAVGVPPWRPLRRMSLEHTAAKETWS